MTLGNRPRTWIVKVDFLVIDWPSAYNVILGKPTLNKIGTIISTACLTMKFFTDDEEIATIRADQVIARKCYNVNLEKTKKKKEDKKEVQPPNSSKVMLVDLDARGWQEVKRPKSNGELEVIQIRSKNDKTTRINKDLPMLLKVELVTFLRKNVDLFA